ETVFRDSIQRHLSLRAKSLLAPWEKPLNYHRGHGNSKLTNGSSRRPELSLDLLPKKDATEIGIGEISRRSCILTTLRKVCWHWNLWILRELRPHARASGLKLSP